ncbi:ferredoxin, partial [Pseudomonas aeruginosa]
PEQFGPAEPHPGGPVLLGLAHRRLRLCGALAPPCPTYDHYGTPGSYNHWRLCLLPARAAADRPRWREAAMPRLDLLLPLDGAAGRPGCLLQSAPLADGSRAVWEWLRDDQEADRGAYALRLGDWRLDGEWTL